MSIPHTWKYTLGAIPACLENGWTLNARYNGSSSGAPYTAVKTALSSALRTGAVRQRGSVRERYTSLYSAGTVFGEPTNPGAEKNRPVILGKAGSFRARRAIPLAKAAPLLTPPTMNPTRGSAEKV